MSGEEMKLAILRRQCVSPSSLDLDNSQKAIVKMVGLQLWNILTEADPF